MASRKTNTLSDILKVQYLPYRLSLASACGNAPASGEQNACEISDLPAYLANIIEMYIYLDI